MRKLKNKKQFSKKTLIQNLGWKFFSSFFVRGGALIFTIILARFLLPEKFGIYNLAMSVALIFLTFSQGGLLETSIRYISSVLGKNNKKKAASYFRYFIKLKLIICSALSLILLILSYPLSFYVFAKPELFFLLIFLSGYIFIFSFKDSFLSVFYAIKKVKYVFMNDLLFQISRIIICLLIFLTVTSAYYLLGIVFGLILSSLIVLFSVLYLTYKKVPFILKKTDELEKKEKKKILKFLFYTTFGATTFALFLHIDTFMLGVLIQDATFIGYYQAASNLILSFGGLLSFGYVLLPIFTQIKKQRLDIAANKVMRYLALLVIPSAFGIAFLGNYFIKFIYGYVYLPATLPLYFLSFILIFAVIISLFRNLFLAKEKPQDYIPLLIGVLIFNIFANYILITNLSKYSLIWATAGAAIATSTSFFIYLISLYYLTKKKLKLKLKISYMVKPLLASLIMVCFLHFFKIYIKDMTLFTGIIQVILGVFVYFIVMLLIKGIRKEDFDLFYEILRIKKTSL